MLRSASLALMAAAAVAVTAGVADAQTAGGGNNNGPRGGYDRQYDYQYPQQYNQGPDRFQGQNGYQGRHRFRGPNRFQGPNGYQGPNGNPGPNRFRGPNGFQGPNGNQGPNGFQGSNGNQGPNRNAPPRNGQAPVTATHGWLGVQIQPLDQNLADALKLTGTNGALISDVQMGTPAATAGIKPGDVVMAVDGKTVNTPRDLATLIAGDQPAMTVTVSVWRNGAKQDVSVTLGSEPGAPQRAPNPGSNAAPPPAAPSLGLTIAPGRGQNGGVAITNVDPNSPAGRAGLASGDQILAVGNTTVATTADVTNAIGAARQAGAKDILMQVQSGRGVRFVAIPFG